MPKKKTPAKKLPKSSKTPASKLRKRDEKESDAFRKHFEIVFRKYHAVFLLMNGNTGQILDANNAALRLYGYSLPQLRLLKIGDINKLPPDESNAERQRAVREERANFIVPQRLANGEIRTVEVHTTPIVFTDATYLLWEISDITERKRAEDVLRSSLAEKETLLREVHHRVKNNLAVVLALVDMQQKAVGDSSLMKSLSELGLRIKAMALVHELLLRSQDFDKIDFQEYVHELVSRLLDSVDAPKDLRFVVSAEGIALSLDTSIPLGMIVNELVMNTLKHAFPEGKTRPGQEECQLCISLERDDALYTLIVADNGKGLPKDSDWETATTLGLRIIKALGTHQLGGVWEYDGSLGTQFILKFKPGQEE